MVPFAVFAQTLGRTDPNAGLFPDSSIVDFSHLLTPPAGKHGFLKADRSGRFVWPDGRRARFWGVNISNKSIWAPKETIDRVVDVLARAGCNMVRFEAVDSTGALLDAPGSDTSRILDPEKLATLDYWTAELSDRGIYYYFDLLDFRQFKPGDDVPSYQEIGRAAKPYAVFDRRLIDLQKEYARQILTHRNPLTGLRYVDDPALALVEICNEHGLFFKATALDTLAEPYGAELRQQWNRWLAQQYGTRDALKAAWGRIYETDVLQPEEDPTSYSVRFPLFTPAPPPPIATDPNAVPNVVDVRRAPGRVRDAVRFLYETQRGYFREMKAALREIGLKVPITGVVSNEVAPDVASAAAECDFTSENYYFDHPAFAGKEWEGTFFYGDNNPIRYSSVYQVAPWLSALRWENKPVVIREWATVWPNRYRAVAIPEMAAYASLQDFDAVLLFGYNIARDPDRLSDFDHQADPTVWGLFALGAETFLRGDIAPSPYSLNLVYTPETLFRWPNTPTNLHRASWFVRLNSTLQMATPNAVTPPAARHVERREETRGQKSAIASRGRVFHADYRKTASALAVGITSSTPLPDILSSLRAGGADVDPKMLQSGMLESSTGQILRNTGTGILKIQTPRTVAICGELPANQPISAGPFTLISATQIGAIMAVSLDGKPLAKSNRYVVKMVSRAENTGQELETAPDGAPAKYHLKAWGKAPILTFGRPGKAMILRRDGKDLISLGLEDGTWELLVSGRQATLVCDTTGVRGTLLGSEIKTGDQPIFVTAPAPPRVPAAKKQATARR